MKRKMVFISGLVSVILLLVFFFGCEVDPIYPTDLVIDPGAVSVYVGMSYQLTAEITPLNAENVTLQWSSDNDEVAAINQEGGFTALAPGTAVITVSSDDDSIYGECTVTVTYYDDIELRVSSFGAGEVELFWTDLALDDFDHVEVSWNPGGSSGVTVAAGIEEYSIDGLSDGFGYTVIVTAVNTTGGRSAGDSISVPKLPASATGVTSIRTAQELAAVNNNYTADYLLLEDIDLTDYLTGNEWFPLGGGRDGFTGTFYGNGHVVDNLTIVKDIENATNGVALFGMVGSPTSTDGRVEYLGVSNVNIDVSGRFSSESNATTGGAWVAGISSMNFGIISHCWVEGSLKGFTEVGGIVGYNSEGVIENCWSDVSIGLTDEYPSENYPNMFGGLVGTDYYGTISNCYTFSVISVCSDSSGVASFGWSNSATVTNCYAVGTISGVTIAGGARGFTSSNVNCTNCFYDTTVSGFTDSESGTFMTTAEMKDVATYTNTSAEDLDSAWDFTGNPNDDIGNEDTWSIDPEINDGYPYLTAVPPLE